MQRLVFILFIFLLVAGNQIQAQFLSKLQVGATDPLYTSYAAPMERSGYKLDQAYRMQWSDPQKQVGFSSEQGGFMGVIFQMNNEICDQLQDYYHSPVVSASYSDIVCMEFSPFRNIRVGSCFNVYSSSSAIWELTITNASAFDVDLVVHPIFEMQDMKNAGFADEAFIFEHKYERDSWMKNHDIPFVEDRRSIYTTDMTPDAYYLLPDKEELISMLQSQRSRASASEAQSVLVLSHSIRLKPGENKKLKIIRAIQSSDAQNDELNIAAEELKNVDINHIIDKNEEIYSQIPDLNFDNSDYALTYWSAFNLMRQCMMPPEGESSYNYYVFSREPKWGWGYGGQVFHESLVMLAYAYMDAHSAMNSQRVYMERQDTAGFINYRTGPYLNENIPHDDQITSSAPWYNYQNLEIFRITNDTAFLKESYESGKAYYNYYISNRDSDGDGLAEWGAHAVLESVRDARVAVWDKVGWPSEFEGPDINSMLVMEAKALAEMSGILGYKQESEKFSTDATQRTELINKYMWDPETSFFYNIDMNDNDFSYQNENDLKIKEIIGFLPLWAGIVDDGRADSLLLSLTNENEFWRNYGIPTLSAKHPYYNPIGYWNGPVWVQWNYLIFRGLMDYGYEQEAQLLAENVLKNIIFHLKTDHTFWEFYSADDLQAGWNHTYIWTAIIARFLIDLNESTHLK